jgi:anti-sigma B factor antagonist
VPESGTGIRDDQTPLAIAVRELNDQTTVMDIDGDLTAQAKAILMDAFTQANTPRGSAVILNFTGLTYANSAGIGLLVAILVRSNRQGPALPA